jgi:hypothetical protein
MNKTACALALASDLPVPTVRNFCAEVRAAVSAHGFRDWLRLKRLLAQMWIEVSSALVETGFSQHRKAASHAALYAVFYNPAKLRTKAVVLLLAQVFVV